MTLTELGIAIPSPVQQLDAPVLKEKQIKLFVKRDDLIHPSVQGNKWRKVKYNLLAFKKLNYSTLLTFGGAFSNHIHAIAAAGKLLKIPTIGVIRGERTTPLSNTLAFAEDCGMKLCFVSRERFKDKEALANEFIESLGSGVYVLPEGGTNALALLGCNEIVEELNHQVFVSIDFIIAACGTGGTLAGLIQASQAHQKVIGIAVLKGDFLHNDITNLLDNQKKVEDFFEKNPLLTEVNNNWTVKSDYHFGGYAKYNTELIDFINQFKEDFGIQLDPVYTGKMFYGLFDLIKKDYFPKGSNIVAIHTGGTQGIEGFNDFRLKNSPVKIML